MATPLLAPILPPLAPAWGHNGTEIDDTTNAVRRLARSCLAQLPPSSGGGAKAAVPVPGSHFVQAVSQVFESGGRIGQGLFRPFGLVHLETETILK